MNTNSIGYYLMPNPTDTAAQAPYLPKLVPNGVANLNDIAKKVAESLPVSEERAKLLIRENFTESLKMALAGYTVDMGALRMKARIPGSMPCEDTPFDPETNACVIELYADGELSGAFDELVPVKLSAEQLRNAIRFSNVMDVETQHMGEIHGTGEFMILGNGITLDAEGESAKLLDRKAGEVLEAIPAPTPVPALEAVYPLSNDGDDEYKDVISNGETSVLHGANLDGASVRFTYRDMDEGEKSFDVPASELTFEDGLVKVSEAFWDGEWFNHADNSFGGTFKVTTAGGSAERHVSYYD